MYFSYPIILIFCINIYAFSIRLGRMILKTLINDMHEEETGENAFPKQRSSDVRSKHFVNMKGLST